MMKLICKLLRTLIIAALAFFVVTFTVYFFNLDMKLTAALEPWLLKWYDRVKKDVHL